MPEESWRGSRNTNTAGLTINNLGKTSYILLAVFAGFGLGMAVYSIYVASLAEREARMLEYYVMELDGKLMKEGIIEADQSWAARKRKREEQK